MRKGIILAGGSGTRLRPLTLGISKQLLPVYNKPMIYYPLSVLMLSDIRDILVITNPHEQDGFRRLLHDGSQWGITISFATQAKPEGIAQAFLIGEEFIDGQPSTLILGDNIFFGHQLTLALKRAYGRDVGATVFGYWVSDPQHYGVVEFDANGHVHRIEEKPTHPKSNYILTGLYFYDERACVFARRIKPSSRGELEITDLNRLYLEQGTLSVELMGRGYAWLDTGTHHSLLQAASFIQIVEERQGLKIGCLEEVAYRMGYIDLDKLVALGDALGKSSYGQYILDVAREESARA